MNITEITNYIIKNYPTILNLTGYELSYKDNYSLLYEKNDLTIKIVSYENNGVNITFFRDKTRLHNLFGPSNIKFQQLFPVRSSFHINGLEYEPHKWYNYVQNIKKSDKMIEDYKRLLKHSNNLPFKQCVINDYRNACELNSKKLIDFLEPIAITYKLEY